MFTIGNRRTNGRVESAWRRRKNELKKESEAASILTSSPVIHGGSLLFAYSILDRVRQMLLQPVPEILLYFALIRRLQRIINDYKQFVVRK